MMVDWIAENPTTVSEASGKGVKEWRYFLRRSDFSRRIPGVRCLGYSPAVRYKYVQPETEDSSLFSDFLDDPTVSFGDIDGPSRDVVMSEFVPPTEDDLYQHVGGFGAPGPDGSHMSGLDLAQLFEELSRLEHWGPQIEGLLDVQLLPKIKVPSSTSPGIRWKKLGYKTKRQALVPATVEATMMVNRMVEEEREYDVPPCGVAGRGKRVDSNRDLSVSDRKDGRLIVMPDLCRHLIGSLGSAPYMARLRSLDHSGGGVMLGMGPFQDQYQQIAEWAKGATSYAFIDFKKFDQRIPRRLLRAVMNHISTRFRTGPGTKAYWSSEMRQLIETEIAMPDGTVYKKQRGVASGDPWTSLADSYANWIILKRVFNRLGLEVKIWTFGDDSVVAVYGPPFQGDLMAAIGRSAWEEFGMVVSKEKSYVTDVMVDIDDDPEPKKSGSFLSMYFLWTEMGVRPTRPLQDLYELMLKPERCRGDVEWEVVRTSMAYLTFYYNSNARYVLREYWDWLHRRFRIPELTGTVRDLELLREMDIPWSSFKLEWLNRLPLDPEVELMYKYGHTKFFPPTLWAHWYSSWDDDPSGNDLIRDIAPD
ncbi:67 kDa protein [Penicillium janczewskii Beauveria bassiana-like virus 1]|uniref:67 kDa protein n=1 Tax=Penicillium janczewskii Beauveria bassiana-like virus 1 TaxID=1755782 RepID=A0A0S2KQA6_9VIRU|nr:67 kDa protein [Penicillium janczewskii Beauveria bassiana-like virus 1]